MQYSLDDVVTEIRRRASFLRRRRRRRSVVCLSLSCAVITASLIGFCIVSTSSTPSSFTSPGMEYATLLISGSAGGYVLAGVIAFMVGVVITLLCLRYRKRHTEGGGNVVRPDGSHEDGSPDVCRKVSDLECQPIAAGKRPETFDDMLDKTSDHRDR